MTTTTNAHHGRRAFFAQAVTVAAPVAASMMLINGGVTAPPAHALDMDAFAASSLSSSSSSPKTMSEDEALCKYGSPSLLTGEACVRSGLSTKRVGSLNAFGKVDRGDFVRCKQFYGDDGNGGYVKKTECDGPR
eukprot:CAMPEP_0198142190 /NCGR_PEP_ID=MMETSP1443-20131203/5061_1 /TAXON_ID=186043 /ORGANISM="Entomoneis sp., Strain CCMP2396" /LENGTH=133 /DNA_ID=CAMNT_0043805151 /DNA_START=195 /DNA_END=596 /DNA_ORIENTATION=-